MDEFVEMNRAVAFVVNDAATTMIYAYSFVGGDSCVLVPAPPRSVAKSFLSCITTTSYINPPAPMPKISCAVSRLLPTSIPPHVLRQNLILI